jgi:hypothetical protein
MRGLLFKGPALSFRSFLAGQRSGISKLRAKWCRSDVRLWRDADLVQRLPSRQLLGVKRTGYAHCELFRV